MSELQQVIERASGQIAHVSDAGSYTVILSPTEAQQLLDAAQLAGPLQERCQLLGRALAAVWSLVGEDDQRAIMAVLDAPTGASKTLPAVDLVRLLERKGAMIAGGGQ